MKSGLLLVGERLTKDQFAVYARSLVNPDTNEQVMNVVTALRSAAQQNQKEEFLKYFGYLRTYAMQILAVLFCYPVVRGIQTLQINGASQPYHVHVAASPSVIEYVFEMLKSQLGPPPEVIFDRSSDVSCVPLSP